MSKSASEQFQIKKKRKYPNTTSDSNNNNNYNKINSINYCRNNNNINKNKYLKSLPKEHNKHIAINNNNFKNFINNNFILKRNSNFDENYFGLLRPPIKLPITNNTILNKMPLSQGYYAKGASLSTKRGLKPLKICIRDDGNNNNKRKLNENNHHKECNNIQYNLYGKTVLSPITAIAGHSLPHQLLHNNSNIHNNNIKQSNQLQLIYNYLFGESLACCGRLPEAFDVYSIIASEQLNGHIPLERLNILASSLIQYMRQIQLNFNSKNENLDSTKNFPNDARTTNLGNNNNINTNNNNLDIFDEPPPMKQICSVLKLSQSSVIVNVQNSPNGINDKSRTFKDLRVPHSISVSDNDFDPLLCPLCRDILRCPVTTNCGHTFCRSCCETITSCNICRIKFPKLNLDDLVKDSTDNTGSNLNNNQDNQNNQNNNPSTVTTFSTIPTFFDNLNDSTIDSNQYIGSELNYSLSPNNYNSINNNNHNNNNNNQYNNSNNNNHNIVVTNMTDYIMPVAQQTAALRLVNSTIASPTTVTTTTVASTTATATTTMASTSSSGSTFSSIKTGSTRCITSSDKMKFMPDVLVRRLVEKWWGADLQARKINETAASYMHLNLLDDALKFCNASLEKSPTNYKSLLLRAEVLFKMNHYQSSLADVENALKSCYTSAKAYYIRALALSEVGRLEEALYNECLAICLDKTTNLSNSEIFQHDLAKILQKFISQKSKYRHDDSRSYLSKAPYSLSAEYKLRRKKVALFNPSNEDTMNVVFDDEDEFLKQPYEYMGITEEDDELLVGGLDFVACLDNHPLNEEKRRAKEYEMLFRRNGSRKHFRRKWMTKDREYMQTANIEEPRCSKIFQSVLDKAEQELQRLNQLETSGESYLKKLVQVPSNLIDPSEFDCVLCSRTLWKPVVTPCGHTYCMVCLDRCIDYKFPCPLCMSPLVESNLNIRQGSCSPVPFVLVKRPITKFLEAAMKRFIPKSYEKRFRQEIEMEPSVPVFICTTAFPAVPCPLFVCEPRYRLMVRRAVESGEKQFGIVQPRSGKTRYFDVGTILDIRDCVMLGNGCSILSTIGCKRFKILARNEKDGYETAKVEYIHDEAITDENVHIVRNMHDIVLQKAIEWYASLSIEKQQEIQQTFGEMPTVEDNWETNADGPAWAWWIIALLPLHPQLRVVILATTSLEKRLRAIEKTLDNLPENFRNKNKSKCDLVVVPNQSGQLGQTDNITEEEELHHLQDDQDTHDGHEQLQIHNDQHTTLMNTNSRQQHDFDSQDDLMISQNIECCQLATNSNPSVNSHQATDSVGSTETFSSTEHTSASHFMF